jgi:hypothetical protein
MICTWGGAVQNEHANIFFGFAQRLAVTTIVQYLNLITLVGARKGGQKEARSITHLSWFLLVGFGDVGCDDPRPPGAAKNPSSYSLRDNQNPTVAGNII